MTIHIELTPDEERVLLEQARLSGRDPAQYAHDIIRGHVSRAQGSASAAGKPPGPRFLGVLRT